ncbi:hypothetical protein DRP04_06590, partial [Archaeoglobales archaeon]
MSSYISYIASIANEYGALITAFAAIITAIATAALAILTYKYLREIRQERMFRLQKEHTENLKRKVIEPWLNKLESIGIAERRNPPLPVIRSTADMVLTYKGDDLEVENEDLFDDLRNHVDSALFQTYNKFKKKCKELSKKYENFKSYLEGYLSTKLRILSWNEFYRSEGLELGFFERSHTLDFFLDSLLSGCKCKVELVNSLKELHKNSEKLYGLLFSSKFDRPPFTGKYSSNYGEYIDKEIKEEKRAEI